MVWAGNGDEEDPEGRLTVIVFVSVVAIVTVTVVVTVVDAGTVVWWGLVSG